jgi:hypothetical protein
VTISTLGSLSHLATRKYPKKEDTDQKDRSEDDTGSAAVPVISEVGKVARSSLQRRRSIRPTFIAQNARAWKGGGSEPPGGVKKRFRAGFIDKAAT